MLVWLKHKETRNGRQFMQRLDQATLFSLIFPISKPFAATLLPSPEKRMPYPRSET